MESGFLDINNYRLRYFVSPGAAPPIVLLHGAGGNALWWKPLAEALRGQRIMLLDLPGHGESSPLKSWEPEEVAVLVFQAVQSYMPDAIIWGGHSWGGKVAAMIAATHPEQTRALLLVDPSPAPGLSASPEELEEFVDKTFIPELGPWPTLEAAAAAVRALPQYRNWNPSLQEAFIHGLHRQADGSWSARVTRDILLKICVATLVKDHAATISQVKCPTLLIFAEQSLSWQEPTNGVAFPQATRVVIPGNHWIHIDNPDAVHHTIHHWLCDTLGTFPTVTTP